MSDSANASPKITIDVDHPPILSLPLVPSTSPVGTVGQEILPPTYSEEQHGVWRELYSRQTKMLKGYVCPEYIRGRELMKFPEDRLPELRELSATLKELSGWELVRVDGLVAGEYFFDFLSKRRFPATDFIRHPDELEYTPAPDMFHDLMGHVPLFTDERFASFFHAFGRAGAYAIKNGKEDALEKLGRIYWFTVEFGLMNPTAHDGDKRDASQATIYGAGIVSSVGEIPHSLSDDVVKHPFHIDTVANREYSIHEMQKDVFEIESFDELESEFEKWAKVQGLL